MDSCDGEVVIGSTLDDVVKKLRKATYPGPDGRRIYGTVTKGGLSGEVNFNRIVAVVRLENIGRQIMLSITSYCRIFDYEVAEDRIAAVRDAIAPLFKQRVDESFSDVRHASTGAPMRVHRLRILV